MIQLIITVALLVTAILASVVQAQALAESGGGGVVYAFAASVFLQTLIAGAALGELLR